MVSCRRRQCDAVLVATAAIGADASAGVAGPGGEDGIESSRVGFNIGQCIPNEIGGSVDCDADRDREVETFEHLSGSGKMEKECFINRFYAGFMVKPSGRKQQSFGIFSIPKVGFSVPNAFLSINHFC